MNKAMADYGPTPISPTTANCRATAGSPSAWTARRRPTPDGPAAASTLLMRTHVSGPVRDSDRFATCNAAKYAGLVFGMFVALVAGVK